MFLDRKFYHCVKIWSQYINNFKSYRGWAESPHAHQKFFRPCGIGLKCFKTDISILMQTRKVNFNSSYPDIQIFIVDWFSYSSDKKAKKAVFRQKFFSQLMDLLLETHFKFRFMFQSFTL